MKHLPSHGKLSKSDDWVLSQKIRGELKIVVIKSKGGNHMISFKWRHFKKDMMLM